MALRTTPASAFEIRGRGLHGGEEARVRVGPASFGEGIVFRVRGIRIPANLDHVVDSAGATTLGAADVRVRTVEHLMAALSGLGFSDAVVEVDGGELPGLDGSAAPWCAVLERVERHVGSVWEPLVVHRDFRWSGLGAEVVFMRCVQPQLAVEVGYAEPGAPRGEFEFGAGACSEFTGEVAAARTFVLAVHMERLRAGGRGRGADAANTVVFDATGPTVPLRWPDEPIRHKCLDWIGDVALLGRPVLGRLVARRGSHAAHVAALRAWRDACARLGEVRC